MSFNLVPPDSIADPLANNVNAVLTFKVGDGYSLNSFTGNLDPSNIITLTFQAIIHSTETFAREQHSNAEFSKVDGRFLKAEWLRGRLINPKVFPSTIGTTSIGRLTIDGRIGNYYLIIPAQNPYTIGVLGTFFYGRFQED